MVRIKTSEYTPTNLERNLMVLEMSLEGFNDDYISSAMSICKSYCAVLRKKVTKQLVKRYGKDPIYNVSVRLQELRRYKLHWLEKVRMMKEDFCLIKGV